MDVEAKGTVKDSVKDFIKDTTLKENNKGTVITYNTYINRERRSSIGLKPLILAI